LFDRLFADMIKDLGITEEAFVKACEAARSHPEGRKVVEQMISADDFVSFKKLMLARNKELNEQAMKYLIIRGIC